MQPAASTNQDDVATIVGLIAERRQRTPQHPAIVDAEGTIELGLLWQRATALAYRLRCLPGFAPEDRVGLLLPRDRSLPIAMLGTILASGAFLPLDPSWPGERLAFILEDAGCRALITSQGMPEPDWAGPRLDVRGPESMATAPPWKADDRPAPDSLAYVIYTSGSTGRPKGVMMEHGPLANLVTSVRDILYRDGGADYGETLTAPVVFDVAMQQILSALTGACCLHILPDAVRRDPAMLLDYVERHRIAQINVVVSHLGLLLENGLAQTAPWLRRIVTGGEPLPLQLVRRLFADAKFERLALVNMYGPAENCVDSTYFVITAGTAAALDRIPLGRPLPGTEVFIVDEGGNPAPQDVVGEICLTGTSLARGYLNRPDATARAFFRNSDFGGGRVYRTGDLGCLRENGLLEFRGRLDNQVKIAGQRVEIEEIEEQLRSIDGVRDATVVYRQHSHGGCLTAFIAAATPPTPSHLRIEAGRRLPAYMVPGAFICAGPSLPLNHNGKVDRAALAASLPAVKPANDTVAARTVAELWHRLLGRDEPNAGFLDLGGDSITAIRLVAGLRSRFGSEISLETVLANITLAELEREVTLGARHVDFAPAPPGVDYVASSAQLRLWYLSQFPENLALYNVPIFRETGPLEPERVRDTMLRLMRRHPALRTALVTRDGVLRQIVTDDSSFPFAVDDLTGHPSQEADAIAAVESLRPLDLACPPPFRLRLLKMAEDRWRFLLVLHHCHVDGWSVSVLLEEFNILYRDPDAVLPRHCSYVDFAHWEQTRDVSRDLDFWQAVLRPPPVRITLPSGGGGGERGRGGLARRTIGRALSQRIAHLARFHATTPATVLMTHYLILLNRLTLQTDLCIGMGVANRPHEDFARCVGCFVNVLPLRVSLAEETTSAALYQQVGASIREALSHQSLPLDVIAARFVPGGGPPFNVLFAWQSYEKVVDLRSSPLPVSVGGQLDHFDYSFGRAKFDLSLYVYPNEETLELLLEYDASVVAAAHADRWLSTFVEFTERLSGHDKSRREEGEGA